MYSLRMNKLISRLLLPAAVMLSMTAFLAVRAAGGNLELAVVAPSVAILLLAMLLEQRMPLRAAWNRPHGDLGVDLTSAAVLFAVVDPALKWLMPVAVVALFHWSGISAAPGWMAAQLPFVAQVALVALLAELGSYWAHRLHHSIPALWWLHALHHGSERLYTLNNFRLHPLNYALNQLAGLLPVLLAGAPPEAVYGYMALTYPVLMLQHANLPLRNGPLNFIFSTSELHRWHHSNEPGEGDSNFGRALVIWDQIFGTFRYRAGANMPRAIGLYKGSRYPATSSFWHQLASMLRPGCCRASN